MTEKGRYIVIEGQDATGKSTQVQLLRGHLEESGIESIEFHEPEDHTMPITSRIREIIKDQTLERDPSTNILLFTAARNEIWKRRASKALKLGQWVIASRNVYSTYAYQGYGEGLDIDLIEKTTLDHLGHEYVNPDFAVILSLDDEDERLRRLAGRGPLETPDTFESKDAAFQRRVTEGYLKVAQTFDLPIVTADRSPEEVQMKIRTLMSQKGILPSPQ